MLDKNDPRCEWNRAITDTYTSEDSHVCKVKIKTSISTYERPVHKLVLLFMLGPGDWHVESLS